MAERARKTRTVTSANVLLGGLAITVIFVSIRVDCRIFVVCLIGLDSGNEVASVHDLSSRRYVRAKCDGGTLSYLKETNGDAQNSENVMHSVKKVMQWVCSCILTD